MNGYDGNGSARTREKINLGSYKLKNRNFLTPLSESNEACGTYLIMNGYDGNGSARTQEKIKSWKLQIKK